jgi:protein farnesyltransferase subunit beta
MDCEGVFTETSDEQCECEQNCSRFLAPISKLKRKTLAQMIERGLLNEDMQICLVRELHAEFLVNGLRGLPGGFAMLDSSKPWICYWIVHALYLIRQEPYDLYPRMISTLSHMQIPGSGYAGGPNQMPHCAATYAAILALCTLREKEGYESIDRAGIYKFFLSCRDPSGGFTMHEGGEVDSRGTYTVVAVASLLNMLTPELTRGTAEYLLRCQTYEGGFGGEPGNEAHGGYNFCAVAALLILGESHRISLDSLQHWLLQRQMRVEGGFQGRTNKLVDSCYSFWQGAAVALVQIIRRGGSHTTDMNDFLRPDSAEAEAEDGEEDVIDLDAAASRGESRSVRKTTATNGHLLFNQDALQAYILRCAQDPEGGLKDKPGKPRDFYHSCYSLSGLSVAQNYSDGAEGSPAHVHGDLNNLLEPTSVVYNVGLSALRESLTYFAEKPSEHSVLVNM